MILQGTRSLGIDISSYAIDVICLKKGITTSLEAMTTVFCPENVFEKGKLSKREEITSLLKKALKQPDFGRVGFEKVFMTIPESECFVLSLKAGPKDKLKDQAKEEIIKNFPCPLSSLSYSYQESGGVLLIVAASKELVEGYSKIAALAGIRLNGLEPESLSVFRSSSRKKNVMIVDVGGRITNFSVFANGLLRMSFSLPIAGGNLTQSLKEKLRISEEKAEEAKKRIGLNPKLEKGRVLLILQKDINEVVKKAKEVQEYFFEKTKMEIEEVIIAGGTAMLPGIKEYFSTNLNLPVEISDPWVTIDIGILNQKKNIQKARKVNPVVYSGAIGAAMRGFLNATEINLIEKRSG